MPARGSPCLRILKARCKREDNSLPMTQRPIDFAKQTGPSKLSWFVLSIGVAALLGAVAANRHVMMQVHEAEHALNIADKASEKDIIARRLAVKPSPAESRLLAQWRAKQAWPWQDVLLAVDVATVSPTHVMNLAWQISADSKQVQLRIEAETPRPEEALVFVEKLQATLIQIDSQLNQKVQLISQQEAVDAGNGASIQRFVVAVQLQAQTDGTTDTSTGVRKP